MAHSRPPGDTALLSEDGSFPWRSGANQYTAVAPIFVDRRPTYAYGARFTLPGGTVFRRSTNYEHTSYEVTVTSPYSADGYSNRSVEDWGREARVYTTSGYTQSAWGNSFHPVLSGALSNEVVTKALLRLADQKAGIGEDLATFKQTLDLFKGKAGILLGALNAVKSKPAWKKYLKQSTREIRRRPLDSAAKGYIEYIYGLKPLVEDVYGVAELLKDLGIRDLLLKGEGHGSRNEDSSSLTPWVHYSYTRVRRVSRYAQAKASCMLWARLDPNHQGLRSLNQLGLLNPLSLAWNLVPWSFVVDWFTPIGPVLEALTAPAGLIFVDGSKSIRTTQSDLHRFEVYSTYWHSDWVGINTYSVGSATVDSEGYSRTHLTSWPLPGFYFASDPFGGDRPLKALALGILTLKKYRLTV